MKFSTIGVSVSSSSLSPEMTITSSQFRMRRIGIGCGIGSGMKMLYKRTKAVKSRCYTLINCKIPLIEIKTRFNEPPSIMMGFCRNIEGIGPHMRFLLVGIVIPRDYFDNHHISIFLFGADKFSDSKSGFNLRTFLVMNAIDGSGGMEESKWFSRLFLFSSSFSSVLSSRESLCCLGWIVMVLIEL
ncbi:hypothetical protein Tco_1290724 [Tanacetum coccineum]